MSPTITKANIQQFFSTARTVEHAHRHFDTKATNFGKPTRHQLRLEKLVNSCVQKGFLQPVMLGSVQAFLTIAGDYVGWNSKS